MKTITKTEISKGEIVLLTEREGLLSAVGHDLWIQVEKFAITIESEQISAIIDLSSLRVKGALLRGQIDQTILSSKDQKEIDGNIAKYLSVTKYPKATYTAKAQKLDAQQIELNGSLSLNGISKPLSFTLRKQDELLVARFVLIPTQWNIPPYRAFLGALKLKDQIVVQISLADPGGW